MQKPRDIRNYILQQDLPFSILAKISVLRFLNGFRAFSTPILKELFYKCKQTTHEEFPHKFVEVIDQFLENRLKFPKSLIEAMSLNDTRGYSEFSKNNVEIFLDKLYSSDFESYFQDLDDDLLGKLNEKRSDHKKGVVYTPKTIIEHMSGDLLQYYLEDTNFNLDEGRLIETKFLKNLTILDPACGSSPFLMKIFEKLCSLFLDCSELGKNIPKSIVSNLYGIDIDKHAICFSRINLWLGSIKFLTESEIEYTFYEISEQLFPIFEENIVLGDALLYVPVTREVWKNRELDLERKIEQIIHCEDSGHILERFLERYFPKLSKTDFRGFNLIIGNPPYISSKDLPQDYKELLRALYQTAVSQFDIYSIFIELSIGILSPKGFFSFIIPESYLGRSSFTESRWLLLNCTSIIKIENIQKAFRKKSISNIILFFQIGESPNNIFEFIHYEDKEHFTVHSGSVVRIPQDYCYTIKNFKILCHPYEIREIIQKLYENTKPLISYIKIHRGEEIGKKSPMILDKLERKAHKIVSGENVKRFCIEPSSKFIRSKDIMKKNAFYFQPKLLVRQLGSRIQAALDEKGEFVTLQTIYNIISTSKSLSHEFLLGLFNSDLIQFYYEVIIREKQIFPRILLEDILNLPLVVPGETKHEKITEIVKSTIQSFDSDKKFDYFTKLNNEIYELYKIREKEKKIIKSHLFR